MSRAREIADRDLAATELILDADNDTSITADTDDQIDIRVAGSDKIQIDATKVELKGTTANTQSGAFPRIQISTVADNNPTYSGALDIVEKQTSASGTAVFGNNGLYGFRMMLDGYNNILKWFSGSQTTVTERMGLARDTGNLTLNTGNLIIGTSGKGIDFTATGDGSGTDSSELLDDYEEGTWTPTATAYGGTFGAFDAQYVKAGRMVHIDCVLSFSGTDSDRVTIAGLPYAATNTSGVAKYFSGGPFSDLMMLVSGTTIVGANTSGDATYTSVSGMTARFSGTYMATA